MNDINNELAQLARVDAEHGARNPFSTPSGRAMWQAGFDGLPLPKYSAKYSMNWRFWRRGQLCAQYLKGATT